MSRENKFRVWCMNNKEWEKDDVFIDGEGNLYQRKGVMSFQPLRKDTHIVMFSTGLKDKNGKEIYEGDIVYEKSWWWGPGYVVLNVGNVGPCHSPCVMSWVISRNIDNPEANLTFNLWDFNKIEVIGNIYQDPKLLEE